MATNKKKPGKKAGNNPHAKFYTLLAMIPYESKESMVYQYSEQTSLRVLYKNRPLYDRMISDLEVLTETPEFKEMNLARKRCIASVAGYFDKAGKYKNLPHAERLKVIKATAVQSTGTDKGFNQLTKQQLITTYNTFNLKQESIMRVDIMTLTDNVCSN